MHFTIKSLVIFILLISNGNALSRTMDVTIQYNSDLDESCSNAKNYKIKDSWKKELKIKQSQLTQEWDNYGEKLLLETENLVGHKFNRAFVTANLALCKTPSRSLPLTINMRYSLSTFTNNPVSIHVKVGTLYHELLHPYITNNLMTNSPLLTLYIKEPQRVKDHLHLLALLKAVYSNVGMADKLSSIIEVDNSLPNGFYKRAWEIVNSTPNYYLEFIGELQTTKPNKALKRN
ncbi:MAG: hypothetical protein HRU06_08090 [Oceanospirillaceae bacterium]|nr:hypothetical protein [Oceanospirillaceae bacterium]